MSTASGSATRFDPLELRGLGDKARSGARLGLLTATVTQLASIGTTVLLARWLLPADFGLIAAATLVASLIVATVQVGLAIALVKRDHVDERVASTIWWTVSGIGMAVSIVMAAFSVGFAAAIGIPDAWPYILMLAPSVFFRFSATVPRALLQRRLQYRELAWAGCAEAVVYSLVQLVLAGAGAGATSVVVGQVTAAVFGFAAAHVIFGWRPTFTFDRAVIREERAFSGGVLGTAVLAWFGKNADYWVAARLGSAHALGVYYIAYVLPNILRARLTWTSSDVLVPMMARVKHDRPRLSAMYLRSVQLHAFVGFPVMCGIALLAPEVVELFFGSGWRGSVAPMRYLAIAAGIEITSQAALSVFVAEGRVAKNVRIEATRLAALLIGLTVAFVADSLAAIGVAVLVGSVIAAVATQLIVCRDLQLDMSAVVRRLLPVAIPTLYMAQVVIAIGHVTDGPSALMAPTLAAVGAATFAGAGFVFFRGEFTVLLGEGLAIAGIGRRRGAS